MSTRLRLHPCHICEALETQLYEMLLASNKSNGIYLVSKESKECVCIRPIASDILQQLSSRKFVLSHPCSRLGIHDKIHTLVCNYLRHLICTKYIYIFLVYICVIAEYINIHETHAYSIRHICRMALFACQ